MRVRDLITAWETLVALSIGTVMIAAIVTSGNRATFAAAGALALAGIKARVILSRYLGLSSSRFWTRAFDLAIGIFLALAFALYTFGLGR